MWQESSCQVVKKVCSIVRLARSAAKDRLWIRLGRSGCARSFGPNLLSSQTHLNTSLFVYWALVHLQLMFVGEQHCQSRMENYVTSKTAAVTHSG